MADLLPYASVNGAINEVFFDGRFAAQPVYLSLDNTLRTELASRLDIDPGSVEEAICETVKSTLSRDGNPFAKHTFDARWWRREGMRTPPPFSAVLYFLSYAAELMEEGTGVASSNYYARLSQVSGFDRETLKKFRDAAEPLWIALNDWLVANNHVLGRPTARTNGSTWRYVEWPMSQAIVRASDRDRFHDLFERFGFSGSETISRADMGHYLASWMLSSAPTPRLKHAWSDKKLRDRVAEAAIAELATWSGSSGLDAGGSQPRTMRLSLLANLVPRFPSQVLELHVGYIGEQQEPVTLANDNGEFQFANDIFGSFATISPSPFMEGNKAFGQSLAFRRVGAGGSMAWEPRLVIPFSRPVQGSHWVEATRLGFGTTHMLLVRDMHDLPARVEAHLMKAAAKWPTMGTPRTLKGVPEGWVLYSDVQVGDASIIPEARDLECLVPLGEGSVLEVSGGFELTAGFFHEKRPPSARLVVPSGRATISIVPIGSSDVLATSPEDGRETGISLAGKVDGHQGVQVRAFRDGELVDDVELFLRDANLPTPLNRDGRGQLRYGSVLSATQWDGSTNGITGMSVEGHASVELAPTGQEAGMGGLPGGSAEEFQEAIFSRPITQQAGRQACIQAGHHHWIVPMVPAHTAGGTPFNAQCKNCHQSLVLIYRPRRVQATVVRKEEPARLQLGTIAGPANDDIQPVDHDLLLDALSFLGNGSWSRFENLLASITPTPQYARQVAQDYASLGLLDLEMRKGSGSIRFWSVPAPSMNTTTSGRAFLAGFRSSNLVEQIGERVEAAGGTLAIENTNGVPKAIFIEGLDKGQLRDAVDGIVDPHGRQVIVNEKPSHALAAACLSLDPLEASLSPVSIGRARNLQAFSLYDAKWMDVEKVVGAGCYRWNEGAQAYAFVDRELAARAGPYQVTKLLAARDQGIRLHAYDQAGEAFSATLGCEPPGLLARALVACSGKLPAMGRGTITYQGVPPAVAATILGILYDRGSR